MSSRAANLSKRVVIVDDHPLIRQGLHRLLSMGDRFNVCGEAGNAADAIRVVRETKPELAIVDITLPDLDGISLTKRMTSEFPAVRVLILSMHDDPDFATRALQAGAKGYMVKQDAIEKIEVALEEVVHGRRYVSPMLASHLGESGAS